MEQDNIEKFDPKQVHHDTPTQVGTQTHSNPHLVNELQTYDEVPLPSEGLFYHNGAKTAKVYYLTAQDETMLTSPNLIKSGKLIDKLLDKKVKVEGLTTSQLLTGDRIALLVFLRCQFQPMYKIQLRDDDGVEFEHEFDLTTLGLTEMKVKPNADGHYDFQLPKSKKIVTFRLLTGEDEQIIRSQDESDKKRLGGVSKNLLYTHQQQIVAVDGDTDKSRIWEFINMMPLMDSRRLMAYVNEVTPTINLKIEVPSPNGGDNFRGSLPITTEFFFPSF